MCGVIMDGRAGGRGGRIKLYIQYIQKYKQETKPKTQNALK